MGQKVHPIGFRLGISKDHNSFWYAKSNKYIYLLQEDIFVRNYINKEFSQAGLSQIVIKRKLNSLNVSIYSARPSLILGNNGENLDKFRKSLSFSLENRFINRDIQINVIEIVNQDSCSSLLAEFIQQQLEKRVPFRRVIKSTIVKAQQAGIKGIKIQISGRLNGAEIARTEWVREGQIPLHTLKANIDYCNYKAHTIYGILGIKVWVYKI
uniref:Small ribosomal subunit protein uS3c n=1 Tax=Discoplastis spathirhyncha TaxID=215771 RepID=A0A3G3LL97_9EUGL|nr:ribosomal protein S3 [Discoplastis spathirhyncha]AYQ93494.1 ribosomal protein S3 [Discoplastis spathirhyncha]